MTIGVLDQGGIVLGGLEGDILEFRLLIGGDRASPDVDSARPPSPLGSYRFCVAEHATVLFHPVLAVGVVGGHVHSGVRLRGTPRRNVLDVAVLTSLGGFRWFCSLVDFLADDDALLESRTRGAGLVLARRESQEAKARLRPATRDLVTINVAGGTMLRMGTGHDIRTSGRVFTDVEIIICVVERETRRRISLGALFNHKCAERWVRSISLGSGRIAGGDPS